MTGAVQTIMMDYGGVLAEEGFRDGLTAIARESGLDLQSSVPAAYEMAWTTGLVLGRCDVAAFWRAFRRATGIARDDAWLTEMVLSRFVLRPFVLDCIDRARTAGMRTAILSDQCQWLERLDARDGFFAHFDAVFNSYRYGVTKREPAFFELALKALATRPETTLFIDDAPRNVDVAASLGLHTILYRDEASFLADWAAACPELGAPRV
jgi:FMN phosphatase YigB (HAD superfamily)